jgi:hypothetical protein
MYNVTGRRLVDSFLRTRTEGRLLICHEGFNGKPPFTNRKLLSFDVRNSGLLASWLAANRDIIPKRFGGSAGLCDCPEPLDPFGNHRQRCHGFWFNQNAARWFRKIASLEYAVTLPVVAIVWLDADCVFKTRLSGREVERWFSGHDVFYHRSPRRDVIESGVLGVRNTPGGRLFVCDTVEHYRSGAFREDLRWDDGFQFQRTLERQPRISAIDLATGATGKTRYGHVVPFSPAGRFLFHNKGIHARTVLVNSQSPTAMC